MLLPLNASDSQILAVARAWADALAAEDYAGALKMVRVHPDMTPQLLRTLITNYGHPEPLRDGSTYRVTSLSTARGGPKPRHEVFRSDDHISVWYDLPLNGKWSDLTATFEVVRGRQGLSLLLIDVRVM